MEDQALLCRWVTRWQEYPPYRLHWASFRWSCPPSCQHQCNHGWLRFCRICFDKIKYKRMTVLYFSFPVQHTPSAQRRTHRPATHHQQLLWEYKITKSMATGKQALVYPFHIFLFSCQLHVFCSFLRSLNELIFVMHATEHTYPCGPFCIHS